MPDESTEQGGVATEGQTDAAAVETENYGDDFDKRFSEWFPETEDDGETAKNPDEKPAETDPKDTVKDGTKPDAKATVKDDGKPAPDPEVESLRKKAAEYDRMVAEMQRQQAEQQAQQQKSEPPPIDPEKLAEQRFAATRQAFRAGGFPDDEQKIRAIIDTNRIGFNHVFEEHFGMKPSDLKAKIAELEQMAQHADERSEHIMSVSERAANQSALSTQAAEIRSEHGDEYMKELAPFVAEIGKEIKAKGWELDAEGKRGPSMRDVFQQAVARHAIFTRKASAKAAAEAKEKETAAAKAKEKAASQRAPEDKGAGKASNGAAPQSSADDFESRYKGLGVI